MATTLKGLKGRRSLTSTDIVAAAIYYAIKAEGKRRFLSDHEKIHEFMYKIVENIPEFNEYFIFTKWYPFRYSYEVEEAISIMRIAHIITVPDNPYYTQYELEETGEKFIEARVLPLIPKKLRSEIKKKAKEFAQILFEKYV